MMKKPITRSCAAGIDCNNAAHSLTLDGNMKYGIPSRIRSAASRLNIVPKFLETIPDNTPKSRVYFYRSVYKTIDTAIFGRVKTII